MHRLHFQEVPSLVMLIGENPAFHVKRAQYILLEGDLLYFKNSIKFGSFSSGFMET